MKFNLKLFVLVGVLAGFRDVCGMEKKVNNKDYGDFIVEGFGENEKKKELEDAMKERSVIKAVYKILRIDEMRIIDSSFKDNLSYILVCDGEEWKKVEAGALTVNMSGIDYDMQQNKKYTVYFIFKNYVKTTKSMFSKCSSLTTLDLSSLDTSNVTDMSFMFGWCSSLKTLNLSNFNTSNVTSMSHMFYECTALMKLDLSSFDTKNVTNMACMFYKCSFFDELDLSEFDTKNVTSMAYMFYECTRLKKLDLSKFNTSSVTYMSYMFKNCPILRQVFLPSKGVDIKKKCICCGDEYVCWNNHEVGGLDPNIVQDKNPE